MFSPRTHCHVSLDANGNLANVSAKPFAGSQKVTEAEFQALAAARNASRTKTLGDLENEILQQFSAGSIDYAVARRALYNLRGLTVENFTLAIVQRECDADPAAFNVFKTQRAAVKTLIPKPAGA